MSSHHRPSSVLSSIFLASPRKFLPALAFFVAASLIVSGCGKNEETDTPGTFTAVYNQTLKTACIECHVPSGAVYNTYGVHLDFSSAASAYQTLRSQNVSGTSSVGTCSGISIVAPSNPQSSYLAAVLVSSYNTNDFAGVTGCQPYTAHLHDQNLSDDEKTSLINWIQNGAQNN